MKAFGLFILCILFSCNQVQEQNNSEKVEIESVEFSSELSYEEFKSFVRDEKTQIKDDSLNEFLSDIYANYIPFYWKGTSWDFNGTSQTPKQGNIACGYFVTNTLNDIGFPVRRIYHAQQASSVMIRDLTNKIKRFNSMNQLLNYLQSHEDNHVFIIGLDFHTGFIIKKNQELYFLHSYYANNVGVIKEQVNKSPALYSSNTYLIGCLTTNEEILKKWQVN